MNTDYTQLDDAKFRKKYGIDKVTYNRLRAQDKLDHFLRGHDTCPRVQYISKITPYNETVNLVDAWNEAKSKYSSTQGLYSGDLECVVCKSVVTETPAKYCKETACMYSKCWKHLATEHGVRILNAHTILGQRTFTTSVDEGLPVMNGVFYSPDNEIIVPALYAWNLKAHLTMMKIMDTPACYNVPLFKSYLQNVFSNGITAAEFIGVLYESNKKIFHNVPEVLQENQGDIITTLVTMKDNFTGLPDDYAGRDMDYQLLFYILFKVALTLDSTKSMYLYTTFVDTVASASGAKTVKSSESVSAYIRNSKYTFPNTVNTVLSDFQVRVRNFEDNCTVVTSERLKDEFEAIGIDLVNPNRIPYVYQSGTNYLDCRTKRAIANYILHDNGNVSSNSVRIQITGSTIRVNVPQTRRHGSMIISPDAPNWYTLAPGQPVILLQRTYRTFYTDKKRGSSSELIIDRLKKTDPRKANTTSTARGGLSHRYANITTDRGQWRYNNM